MKVGDGLYMEKHLIQKSYYEQVYMGEEDRDPVKVLGELFYEEQKTEFPDLAQIRFAQGEIYYHIQDYETAIFKWEQVHNELEPWAKKNIADAYMELDLKETAEEIYRSISTDSETLNAETALQLFGIYISENRNEEANDTIKQLLATNRDYPNVAELAWAFFDKQKDWESAIQLSVNESMQTKSNKWFERLNHYIQKGHGTVFEPAYYIPLLTIMAEVNLPFFEKVTVHLSKMYLGDSSYLNWLTELNELILANKNIRSGHLDQLPALYDKAYQHLISGEFTMKEVGDIIPQVLTAWQAMADEATVYRVSTAILSWNELFPQTILEHHVELAKASIEQSTTDIYVMDEVVSLFQTLKTWAGSQDIDLSNFISDEQLKELTQLDKEHDDLNENTDALLTLTRNSIEYIIEQQGHVESHLESEIEQSEDLFARVNGSINQLKDIEEEQIKLITEGYQKIKEEIEADLLTTVPKLIKESIKSIKDDSDFRNIHLELNTEMNDRIQSYLNNTVLAIYENSLHDWISFSESELRKSQERLQEWSEGFNEFLGEERIVLQCDFQILADWKRDADRLTTSIQIDSENILLKRTPSQVILKSAGKLLGVLPKNNAVLAKSYRNFIENESFFETAASIAKKFFRPFELLENSIARDIQIFFRNPHYKLKEIVKELEEKIEWTKQQLDKMKTDPESFQDPLIFAKAKLRQYEWMNNQMKNQSIK